MGMTATQPPEQDSSTENACELLNQAGYDCKKVYRVWSAGESDFRKETILFINGKGLPRTAIVTGDGIDIERGW